MLASLSEKESPTLLGRSCFPVALLCFPCWSCLLLLELQICWSRAAACLSAFAFTLLLLCPPLTDYRTSPKPSIYLSNLQVCLFCGCLFIHSPISGPFPLFFFSFFLRRVCANNFYRYGSSYNSPSQTAKRETPLLYCSHPHTHTHTHTQLRFGILHFNPTHTRPTCPTLLRTLERIANDRSSIVYSGDTCVGFAWSSLSLVSSSFI